MPTYNRVKHYNLGIPYWDIDIIIPSYNDENYSYKYKINTEIIMPGEIIANNEYRLPGFITTNNLINVDWGDGSFDYNVADIKMLHTYSSPGIYTIKLYPNYGQRIKQIRHNQGYFFGIKVIELIDWGNNVADWSDMIVHFLSCQNLTGFTTSAPDLSNVNNVSGMFLGATSFNNDVSSWDMSNITNTSAMFYDTLFNQDISSWNFTKIDDMSGMFMNSPFNQDISSWNVGTARYVFDMFRNTPFNQDISSWDTSNVIRMDGMFRDSAFNQDLGNWNISSLTNAPNMFDNCPLSTTNYDNLLIGWAAQAPNIQSNVLFGAAGINRTSASLSAYNTLTTTYNWTITDAGLI